MAFSASRLPRGFGPRPDGRPRAASPVIFGFLQVASGHGLVLPATKTNYSIQYLSLGAGATLDIKNDTLTYVGGTPGARNGSAYTGLLGLLASGRNGGAWNGHGIISSSPTPARVFSDVALVTQGNNVVLRQTYAGATSTSTASSTETIISSSTQTTRP